MTDASNWGAAAARAGHCCPKRIRAVNAGAAVAMAERSRLTAAATLSTVWKSVAWTVKEAGSPRAVHSVPGNGPGSFAQNERGS